MSATVTKLHPAPTLLDIVEALRTTNDAIELAIREIAKHQEVPLCLSLAHERNRRLLQRMEVK